MLFISVWVRATLPRLKYNQLMDLGWKRLLPGALVLIVITAVGAVMFNDPSSPLKVLFGSLR
jgi:NADH-quinone oxidoreductase subunit H